MNSGPLSTRMYAGAPLVAFDEKQRIIAEAAAAPLLGQDPPLADALHHHLLAAYGTVGIVNHADAHTVVS